MINTGVEYKFPYVTDLYGSRENTYTSMFKNYTPHYSL